MIQNKGTSIAAETVKRLKMETVGSTDRINRFFVKCFDRDYSTKYKPGMVINIGEPFWGLDDSIDNQLYVRKEYIIFAEEILPNIQKSPTHNMKYIIAGAKGVGKSIFGVYLAWEAVSSGCAVIFYRQNSSLLMFGKNVKDEILYEINDSCNDAKIPPFSRSNEVQIYSLELCPPLQKALWSRSKMLVIYDNDLTLYEFQTGACVQVLITSPDNEKIKQFDNNGMAQFLYLPPWSLKELMAAYSEMRVDQPKDMDEVIEMYEKFGGCPRYVMSPNADMQLTKLNMVIEQSRLDQLSDLFGSAYSSMGLVKRDVRLILIHPIPIKETGANGDMIVNYKKSKNVFASKYVESRLISNYQMLRNFSTRELIEGCKQIRTFNAGRGALFEQVVHQSLIDKDFTYLNKSLEDLQSHKTLDLQKRSEVWPKFGKVIEVEKMNLSDVSNKVTQEMYFKPMISTFPTLDSFCLMPYSLFEEKKTSKSGYCLLGFQMTIKNRHKVDGEKLEMVRSKMLSLIADAGLKSEVEKNPFVLVFVCDDNSIKVAQAVKNPQAFAVEQFVMKVIGLDELAKAARDAIQSD